MDVGDLLPPRSVEDILAERVRLVIGGQEYVLPVPVIAVAEAWKADLDEVMTAMLAAASDDPGEAMNAMASDAGPFLALLASFDVGGVLPDREAIRQTATPLALLCAVLEVWRAVNPLVDIGLGVWATTTRTSAMPLRTSASLPSTGGQPATSGLS